MMITLVSSLHRHSPVRFESCRLVSVVGIVLLSLSGVVRTSSARSPSSSEAAQTGEDASEASDETSSNDERTDESGSASESESKDEAESEGTVTLEPGSTSNDTSSTESGSSESDGAVSVPEVEVIGRSDKDVESVPGSADVVTEEELDQQKALNTNEALRMVPGVHVQPEEGMGLRQNIGIRGLNPTRSRKVLVLEDGVPIALGPYGEPEMYYSPPVERMSRIEVVKGSGSILFGPQTIGGVINYITPQPPEDFTFESEARGGTYDYYQGEVTIGDTKGQVGYWLNGLHQRFGGHRGLDLRMTDVTSKFRLQLDDRQSLSLKFNVYDEWSRSTYLGLTTPQYQNDPSANYAKHDRFKIRRYGVQATHVATPSSNLLVETRLYGHNIQRNWRRQDFDRTASCEQDDCYVRVINGRGEDVVDSPSEWPNDQSGVFFRDTTGNRNREFTVGGIEPRVTWDWELGSVAGELQAGTRFHIEHTRERRLNGNTDVSPAGTIRDDDERIGRAVAAYALNTFEFFDGDLQLSPGLRFESLWTERTVHRTRVDGEPTDLDPPRTNDNHIQAFIPGAGVSYNLLEPLTLFGGVHRGFAPPRTKDAITKEGQKLKLEPEFSWNYEAGARVRMADWLQAETAAFLLDFRNQIIAPAEAGGAVSVDPEARDPGTLKAVQGGRTTHKGLEFGATFDPATLSEAGFDLPLSVNYTFVDARFGEGWQQAIRGNQLPYAPRHTIAGRASFQHPIGLSLQLDGDWVSGQYTDKVETVRSGPAGLIGWIDSRFILDAKVSYTHEPSGLTGFVAGKNLLNEQYVSSRAPRGIKPGLFRHVYGGVSFKL